MISAPAARGRGLVLGWADHFPQQNWTHCFVEGIQAVGLMGWGAGQKARATRKASWRKKGDPEWTVKYEGSKR